MDDAELIRRELRAAREELIRKQSQCSGAPDESTSRLPLMPDREEAFLRLALMSVDELEAHVDRLERDLEDLEQGFDRPDE
jgi:polyhydroxyalkanoate synthesis regulator phasin